MATAYKLDSTVFFASTNSTCVAVMGPLTIMVPADAPPGIITITGKHIVKVGHLGPAAYNGTTGTTDRGYLIWSETSGDCVGPDAAAPDTRRSYFGVPAVLQSASFELTVPTLGVFPAGGG